MPSSGVQFDEEKRDFPEIPRPKPVTLKDALLKSEIVHTRGGAGIILAIAIALLIGVSLYLMASAVSTPLLSPDQQETK